nr:T9SS type A sorting domain-containing protein [Hymenobacter jeongseonensis]
MTEAATGCFVTPDVVVSHTGKFPRGLDRETGGQFTLGQNYPNPYIGETTVPFTLTHGGDVRLDLFDVAGRKMAGISRKGMTAGAQTISLNLSGLGLPSGDYLYQLQVTNSHGVYRQSKMMTAG